MEPYVTGPSAGAKRSADIQKAELERKSRDLFKVFNPTNQPYEVILNAKISPEVWTIPAKEGDRYGELTVPNYVRIKYIEEMVEKIITVKSDRAIIEENEKRQQRGFPKMDLHTEQYRFESRNLKNLMSKREQMAKILDGGLVKEYGLGGQTQQPTDKKQHLSEFDPGIDVLSGQPTTPPTPLTDIDENALQQATMPQNQTDEPKVATSLVCDICGKECASDFGLQSHRRHHKEPVQPTPDISKVVEEIDG